MCNAINVKNIPQQAKSKVTKNSPNGQMLFNKWKSKQEKNFGN